MQYTFLAGLSHTQPSQPRSCQTIRVERWNVTALLGKNVNSNAGFYNPNKGTSTIFNVGLTPGIVYFITNKIGIETSIGLIGYSVQDYKNFIDDRQTGGGNTSAFNVNFSMSTLYLGLNFYFGGNKDESKQVTK